ncbi:hypothetical protein T492DRAFT_845818 [Pavlovales sp. CCMP2436]|nr:hypothetical protein T492DRAFT_845818 [Pavlovales sp. CCMP2436]
MSTECVIGSGSKCPARASAATSRFSGPLSHVTSVVSSYGSRSSCMQSTSVGNCSSKPCSGTVWLPHSSALVPPPLPIPTRRACHPSTCIPMDGIGFANNTRLRAMHRRLRRRQSRAPKRPLARPRGREGVSSARGSRRHPVRTDPDLVLVLVIADVDYLARVSRPRCDWQLAGLLVEVAAATAQAVKEVLVRARNPVNPLVVRQPVCVVNGLRQGLSDCWLSCAPALALALDALALGARHRQRRA